MVFSANFNKSVACQQSWPEFGRLPYWGKLQERVYHNRIRDVDQLKSRLIEEWEQYHNSSSRSLTKRSVVLASWSLHSSTRSTFRTQTQTLGRPTVRYLFRDTLTVNCLRPLPISDTSFFQCPVVGQFA